MKQLKVYSPQCSVLLHKIVDRKAVAGSVPVSTRFANSQRTTIDLTPFLSEQGGIHTSKSVSAPAGGFSLTLIDKPFVKDGGFESLYGLIEPMDMVEIRIAREPHKYRGGKLPIVMRGFVSEVTRSEAMTPDGRPSRQVIIAGQDWGKVWQLIQLKYFSGYLPGAAFLTSFHLFERYDVGFVTGMSASGFLQQVVDKIINPFIADFMPDRVDLPKSLTTEISAPAASVSVAATQSQEGALYGLLRSFLDVGAFNELYLEDRETGVVCVYRPNPFKDIALTSTVELGGPYIQPQAYPPVHVGIEGADIVSMSLSRSDANVANFFWVTAPRFEFLQGALKLYALSGDLKKVSITDYPNASVKLYGMRLMEEMSMQGLDSVQTASSQKEAENQKETDGYASWANSRRDVLRVQNKDNVVFEHGTMTLKGNADIRAGCYLRLERGSMTSEFYVTNVVHQFVPFGAFTTTVNVERGTSFAERVKRGFGRESPYLSEMA